MKVRECTRREFEQFISEYPYPLEKSVLTIMEPPPLQYNDFSGGKVWPESVVAQELEELDLEYNPTEQTRYWIAT